MGHEVIGQTERAVSRHVAAASWRLTTNGCLPNRYCGVYSDSPAWMISPQWGQTSGSLRRFPISLAKPDAKIPAGKANMPMPMMATIAPRRRPSGRKPGRRRHSPPWSVLLLPTTWPPECLKTRPAAPRAPQYRESLSRAPGARRQRRALSSARYVRRVALCQKSASTRNSG